MNQQLKQLRKYSDRHYFNDHRIFGGIKSRADIEIAERHVSGRLNSLNKVNPLVEDDIIDLERAMGKFEIAVRKAIQFSNYSEFNYSPEELQSLIDKVLKYQDEVGEVAFRKLMQD